MNEIELLNNAKSPFPVVPNIPVTITEVIKLNAVLIICETKINDTFFLTDIGFIVSCTLYYFVYYALIQLLLWFR